MKFLLNTGALLLLFFFVSCDNNNEAAAALEDAQADLEAMIPEDNERVDAQLADYNWLKQYLPERVGNKTMSSSKAELTNMMSYKISRAEATYGAFNQTSITISDVINAGPELGQLEAWVENNLDEVDGDSFTRTSMTDNEYRTLEKYSADQGTATVSVFVGDRYLITAFSDNEFKVDELKSAIMSMDLKVMSGQEQYSQLGEEL